MHEMRVPPMSKPKAKTNGEFHFVIHLIQCPMAQSHVLYEITPESKSHACEAHGLGKRSLV